MPSGLAPDSNAADVRVDAIAPGLIATAMTEAPRSRPAVLEELYQPALVKRFAAPEELIGAAVSLGSRSHAGLPVSAPVLVTAVAVGCLASVPRGTIVVDCDPAP